MLLLTTGHPGTPDRPSDKHREKLPTASSSCPCIPLPKISGWTGGPNTSTLSLFQAGDLLTDGGTPAALWGPLGMPPTLPNAVQGVPKHQKNSQTNCSEVECSHFYFFLTLFVSPGRSFCPRSSCWPPGGRSTSREQSGSILACRSQVPRLWEMAPCLGQRPGPPSCLVLLFR